MKQLETDCSKLQAEQKSLEQERSDEASTRDMNSAKRVCTVGARAVTASSIPGRHTLITARRELANVRSERLNLEGQFLAREAQHLERLEALIEREARLEQDLTAISDPSGNKNAQMMASLPSTVLEKHFGKRLLLHFDGASKNNPGEAGAGWTLVNDDGPPIAFGWKFLGYSTTNNEAEYSGFIEGLLFVQNKLKLSRL